MAINNAALWAKQSELENKTITGTISINREKMMEKAMSNAGDKTALEHSSTRSRVLGSVSSRWKTYRTTQNLHMYRACGILIQLDFSK